MIRSSGSRQPCTGAGALVCAPSSSLTGLTSSSCLTAVACCTESDIFVASLDRQDGKILSLGSVGGPKADSAGVQCACACAYVRACVRASVRATLCICAYLLRASVYS